MHGSGTFIHGDFCSMLNASLDITSVVFQDVSTPACWNDGLLMSVQQGGCFLWSVVAVAGCSTLFTPRGTLIPRFMELRTPTDLE
jgi:hypothetical protein